MMLTREQAAATWCPMVRVARREQSVRYETGDGDAVVVGGCNSDALGLNRVPASCRCIADGCAMWRWERPADGVPARGYCGLAGVPYVAGGAP
jgi:hypothetical protein